MFYVATEKSTIQNLIPCNLPFMFHIYVLYTKTHTKHIYEYRADVTFITLSVHTRVDFRRFHSKCVEENKLVLYKHWNKNILLYYTSIPVEHHWISFWKMKKIRTSFLCHKEFGMFQSFSVVVFAEVFHYPL